MLKFILIVIGLTIVICKPFLLLIGICIAVTWLLLKRPNCFTRLPAHLTMPPGKGETEPNMNEERWAKEDTDGLEEADHKAEAAMKPGYKNDKDWMELTKKVGKHVADNQRKEENAMRLEELTDEVV